MPALLFPPVFGQEPFDITPPGRDPTRLPEDVQQFVTSKATKELITKTVALIGSTPIGKVGKFLIEELLEPGPLGQGEEAALQRQRQTRISIDWAIRSQAFDRYLLDMSKTDP